MISLFVLFLIFVLLGYIESFNGFYLNLVFFISSIILFILRLKGIYLNELSDINFYSFFFLSACVFIYFLIDLLKEKKVDSYTVLFHFSVIFISLSNELSVYLGSVLFFNLIKEKSLSITSFNDFLVSLTTLSPLVFYDFIYSGDEMFIFYFVVLAYITLYKRLIYLSFKLPILLLILFHSLNMYEYIFILSYIYMLYFAVTCSDFIKENLASKTSIVNNVEKFVKRYSYEISTNHFVFKDVENKDIQKSDLPTRYNFIDFDERFYFPLIVVNILILFFICWSWKL